MCFTVKHRVGSILASSKRILDPCIKFIMKISLPWLGQSSQALSDRTTILTSQTLWQCLGLGEVSGPRVLVAPEVGKKWLLLSGVEWFMIRRDLHLNILPLHLLHLAQTHWYTSLGCRKRKGESIQPAGIQFSQFELCGFTLSSWLAASSVAMCTHRHVFVKDVWPEVFGHVAYMHQILCVVVKRCRYCQCRCSMCRLRLVWKVLVSEKNDLSNYAWCYSSKYHIYPSRRWWPCLKGQGFHNWWQQSAIAWTAVRVSWNNSLGLTQLSASCLF